MLLDARSACTMCFWTSERTRPHLPPSFYVTSKLWSPFTWQHHPGPLTLNAQQRIYVLGELERLRLSKALTVNSPHQVYPHHLHDQMVCSSLCQQRGQTAVYHVLRRKGDWLRPALIKDFYTPAFWGWPLTSWTLTLCSLFLTVIHSNCQWL